jgi:hypothetical protein
MATQSVFKICFWSLEIGVKKCIILNLLQKNMYEKKLTNWEFFTWYGKLILTKNLKFVKKVLHF